MWQPPQCDPWAEYRANAAWSSQPWSYHNGAQGGGWGGQWTGNWGVRWISPPRASDSKDIERPEECIGDITKLFWWSKAFTSFLRRQNWRWPGSLEKIQDGDRRRRKAMGLGNLDWAVSIYCTKF